MSKISKLAGDTFLYGLGSIVPRAINFILVPIHTRIFLAEEYGVVTYFYGFVAFLNVVYTFGMETAYFRFATREGTDQKATFNFAQTAVTSISLFLSLLFILFSTPISQGLKLPEQSSQVIIWLALLMFIDALVAIPFARLRLEKKPLQFVLARSINVLLVLGLNLLFFIYSDLAAGSDFPVSYVFLANLLANAFYLLFFLKILLTWKPQFDRTIFPSMLRYAYPIMVTGLAAMTNEMSGRIMLEQLIPKGYYEGKDSLYAVGLFGAAVKYAVFLNLGIQAFRYAAEPFFFSNAEDKNSPKLFARVNHYFVITGSFILLSIVINLDILKFLVAEEYYEGLSIVPLWLLGFLFLGLYYNFSVWYKLTDRTYFGTIITVGGAVITIALNFLLIPTWGIMGASWASLTCYFCMAVACYIFGQKFYPIPYSIARGAAYIIGSLVLILISMEINFPNQVMSTGFHLLIMGLFAGIAVLLERKHISDSKP